MNDVKENINAYLKFKNITPINNVERNVKEASENWLLENINGNLFAEKKHNLICCIQSVIKKLGEVSPNNTISNFYLGGIYSDFYFSIIDEGLSGSFISFDESSKITISYLLNEIIMFKNNIINCENIIEIINEIENTKIIMK